MAEDAWKVPDVYLLVEGQEGQVAVPDLTLTFGAEGIELDKTDGEMVWDCRWEALEEISPAERSVLPDGRNGVVIEVVERDGCRRHRLVVAADDTDAVEGWVRERAGSHGLRTTSPRAAVPRLLLVAIGLAFGATLTVLLLSAAHVIHF
jgi:hypothetical protein